MNSSSETSQIAEIEGYAARYDAPDRVGDIIVRGAFRKTLQNRTAPVRMLYQHAPETPIGRWTDFRETSAGLIARGEILLASPRAKEIHALLAGGAIDGLSIGYQTVRARKGRAGRRILEAELWEVSIVTFPMAPGARVTRIGAPTSDDQHPLRASVPGPRPLAQRPSRQDGARPGGRAFSSPRLNARHFAAVLRDAASILSV
jgi:HK97 family phage prohead protease